LASRPRSKNRPGPTTLRIVLIAGVACILFAIGYCGLQVHRLSDKQEHIKKDYMVINSVSFGLLSVDEWRDNIISAVKYQIQQFKLTPRQNQDLKKEIEQILHGLVDTAVASIEKPQKTIGGKIEKLAFHVFVNKKKLQEKVPGFAQKIIDEINKPSSYKRLKDIAQTEVDQLGKQTYDSSKAAEKNLTDSIFKKYGATDKPSFEKKTESDLVLVRKQTYSFAFGMLSGIVLILIFWWLIRNRKELYTPLYIMSILSALILLVVGLTTTMIQIDARIEQMDFYLLGQNVTFKNQVLFFQSKSIVDVVHILINTGKLDSEIVGVLILIFSIIFPVFKLLSTGIYMLDQKRWAKNKFVYYFAFKSGKWSMADVMVVAILMTFIGFNGIVNSTLSDLNLDNGSISSITTNNTSIQPGYIIFIGFVLYGFTLSAILKKITHEKESFLKPAAVTPVSPTR
jgi:Paraquat-inducible protein A